MKHSYDALGRLADLASSDGTIHYSYTYDKNNNPLTIYDHVHNLQNNRSYDPWNRLVQDSFLNGLEIQLQYDPLGRASAVTLPDGSSCNYIYNNGHLSDVMRYNSSHVEQYRHSYTSIDLQEHVLASTLINSCGTATLSYDIQGRPQNISTPSWSETIPADGFDAAGSLNHLSITDPVGTSPCNFSYDDLYQLIKEDGIASHEYKNDALANRLAVDMNFYKMDGLNKIIRTRDLFFTYDKNGNLTSRTEKGKTTGITYRYDALNRLIEVKADGLFTAEYLYDSFGRRLSKKITTPGGINDSYLQFVYWSNFEIASYDAQKHPIHFRTLGRGHGADVGAAVALELNGTTYCPIHDARGDIVELLSQNGTTVETIRYSAFGLAQIYNASRELVDQSRSPWLYASKRFDPETGFCHFSKRYYSPELGRWVTPDPLGYADGPNLYAYVHLNPLVLFDPYGMLATLDTHAGYDSSTPSPRLDTQMDDRTGSLAAKSWLSGLSLNNMPPPNGPDMLTWRDCWRGYRNFSDQYDYSNTYHLQGMPFEQGGMSYTNGMHTDLTGAIQATEHFSQLGGGREMELCFNDTKGRWLGEERFGRIGRCLSYLPDLPDICLESSHYDTKAILVTRAEMLYWADSHPNDNELYLKICHSEGALIVREALRGLPPNIQQRILVLAIAPAAYIDKSLCYGVKHLVSDKDYVPTFDRAGRAMAEKQGTIEHLHACPEAGWWDHDVFSGTYQKPIQEFMDNYIAKPRKQ